MRLSPVPLSATSCETYKGSPYPNDHAAYTNGLKIKAGYDALMEGESFIYSDLDALWLKDPRDMLNGLDVDLAFQPGSFPAIVKSLHGFAMCGGFFYMRPGSRSVALLEKVQRKMRGSDQLAFNLELMNSYDVEWEQRPEDWEHCRVEDGWTAPIMGRCRTTGLLLAALPHAFFQRHNLDRAGLDHCIICHPNVEKVQDSKFAAFARLGIEVPVP